MGYGAIGGSDIGKRHIGPYAYERAANQSEQAAMKSLETGDISIVTRESMEANKFMTIATLLATNTANWIGFVSGARMVTEDGKDLPVNIENDYAKT